MKIGSRASFGSGLLKNACKALLWPVFGPCMMGFEVGFDSGVVVCKIGKIGKIGKKIYPVLGAARSHG